MLLYYLFWMFMGFIKHFYITFWTNLLTQSPVPVHVFPLFLCSPILPFHHFLYSLRSVTPIGLKFEHDIYPDIGFLVAKEGHQPPYKVATRVRGVPPASWATRASSRVDSSTQKSHTFQKISVSFLSRLDSV